MTEEALKKKRESNARWMAKQRKLFPEKYLARGRAWYKDNPDKAKAWRDSWQANPNNAEKKRRYNNTRYVRLKPLLLNQRAEWQRKKLFSDPVFRCRCSARTRVKIFLKKNGFKPDSSTSKMLGCTKDELRTHIESRFQPGMNWSNYGQFGWHIDHIIPLASAGTEEDVKKLCHFTNLQPLWWDQNLKKGTCAEWTITGEKPDITK